MLPYCSDPVWRGTEWRGTVRHTSEQIQPAQEEEEFGPLVTAEEFAEPDAMEPPVAGPAETEEPRRSARSNKGVPPPRFGY